MEHNKVDTKNVNIFMINTLTMTDLYFYIVGYNTSLFYNFFSIIQFNSYNKGF